MSKRTMSARQSRGARSGRRADVECMGEMDIGAAGGNGNANETLRQRRRIRHEYRNLITDTQRNRLDLINPASSGLGDSLDKANDLFWQVKDSTATREAALDSQFLVLAISLGNQQAHQLRTDLMVFEPTEFVEKVVTFMSGRQIDMEGSDQQERRIPKGSWAKLGREVFPLFRRVPAFHFMLGSFERGEVTKTKRVANRRKMSDKELGPKVRPEQLANLEKNQKEVTTEEVEKMLSILKQVTQSTEDSSESEAISYFEFIVNPESFAQTVENMFHLSFLVKDGHAEIYLDEDNLPVVAPTEPYVDGQTEQRVEKKQVMVSMDKDQWREIKRTFEIDRPIIPTRSTKQMESNGYHDESDSDAS